MLQTLLFRTPVRAYRMVYVGALLSYAIVVLKSLGKPRGVNWLRRAFVDENFQYGLLALYWLISKPINSEFERARVLRRSTSASRMFPGVTSVPRLASGTSESLRRVLREARTRTSVPRDTNVSDRSARRSSVRVGWTHGEERNTPAVACWSMS